jgi:hypothetical protein
MMNKSDPDRNLCSKPAEEYDATFPAESDADTQTTDDDDAVIATTNHATDDAVIATTDHATVDAAAVNSTWVECDKCKKVREVLDACLFAIQCDM